MTFRGEDMDVASVTVIEGALTVKRVLEPRLG
jgi:hypothetical protein